MTKKHFQQLAMELRMTYYLLAAINTDERVLLIFKGHVDSMVKMCQSANNNFKRDQFLDMIYGGR
jgi:hypothetical protein